MILGDGLIPVFVRVRRGGCAAPLIPHARVRFLHHLFAEVHANQIVLVEVVVKHVLGGLAQVDHPLAEGGWAHAERRHLRAARR